MRRKVEMSRREQNYDYTPAWLSPSILLWSDWPDVTCEPGSPVTSQRSMFGHKNQVNLYELLKPLRELCGMRCTVPATLLINCLCHKVKGQPTGAFYQQHTSRPQYWKIPVPVCQLSCSRVCDLYSYEPESLVPFSNFIFTKSHFKNK